LIGGFLLAGLAVMTAASAVSNILFSRPFSADYELVKHFVAVAIFMFLPYCQLSGANVSVDIFTEGMSERAKSTMGIVASILAIAFAAMLFRQMWLGMESYIRYPEMTPVLHLPLWTAFPPMLLSLLLLLAAAFLTAVDSWRGMWGAPKLLGHPSAAD
jgi:TRAP-type C4-dicarboxylate transport system permease small subunit